MEQNASISKSMSRDLTPGLTSRYRNFDLKPKSNYVEAPKPYTDKLVTMNLDDIIKKGFGSFDKDVALANSQNKKVALYKNALGKNDKNDVSFTVKRDDPEVFEEHMDQEVKEDKRFSGKYANVKKISQLGP
jgi:hypothetical protein